MNVYESENFSSQKFQRGRLGFSMELQTVPEEIRWIKVNKSCISFQTNSMRGILLNNLREVQLSWLAVSESIKMKTFIILFSTATFGF